jgi:gliding motility-associated-like protein
MLKNCISSLVLLLTTTFVFAQSPKLITIKSLPDTGERAACDNLAGNATQTLKAGAQSNDKKYLCKNDALIIKSSGTVNLTSDPVAATPAGTGYLFLTCNPTKSGQTIQDIASDPCIWKANGTVPANGFYVNTSNNTKGDATFINDGSLQNTYNSGKPYRLVFAPITFDALDVQGRPVYEAAPPATCVNVTTAAAFEVIYLNEIKTTVVSQGDKAGSFKITGGLSEYDNSTTNYTIDITLKGNPAQKGTVTSGAAKHNGTVTFTTSVNGIYTINIEDGKSCGRTFDMTLSSALDIDVKADTVTCFGNSDGSFSVVPIGGTGPYSFVWKKTGGTNSASQALPLSGATISGLTFGTYTIEATDNAGVTVTKNVNVVQASSIFSVTTSKTDPKCIGSKDGSVTANVAGGFGPYYFEWSTGEKGFGANTITNVGIDPVTGANDYAVTVTDKAGCKKVSTTNLTVNTIQIAKTIKDATCSGKTDGLIDIEPSGGTTASGNYSFKWSTGFSQVAKKSILPNLKEGKYCVTITDDNNCPFVECFDVKPGKTLSMNAVVTDNKCFDDKNGKIVVTTTVTGGSSSSFQYAFTPANAGVSNVAGNTISYEQLPAGKYTVTVTDADGCEATIKDTIRLKQPPKLELSTIALKDPTCTGGLKDGQIEVKVIGGTLAAGSNYKYQWENLSNNPKRSNLSAGTYDIAVTDDNNCLVKETFNLKQPSTPKIDELIVADVDCSNSTNGRVESKVTPALPTDILTYKWSNNATTKDIFDLAPNKYTLVLTDQNGCTATETAEVKAPAPIVVVDSLINLPTCTNDKDGKITLSVIGGNKPYTFTWQVDGVPFTSASGDSVLTGLPGRLYTIGIKDSKGCEAPPLLINVPKPLTTKVSFTGIKPVTCKNSGDCDGVATCNIVQTQDPNAVFTTIWNSNESGVLSVQTPDKQTKLCIGWNVIEITDGKCPITDSVFIESPELVALDTIKTEVKNVRCFGETNGEILAAAKGGIPPYTFLWDSNNTTTPLITNLGKSVQILTIKDANGCAQVVNIPITEPAQLAATKQVEDASCNGLKDGVFELVEVKGGTPFPSTGDPRNGYSYAWTSNVATTFKANGLAAASDPYNVTITDANGCSLVIADYVNEPTPITFEVEDIIQPLCAGNLTDIKIKSASGGGGNDPNDYTFSIDEEGSEKIVGGAIPTYAGTHIVRVIDPNGCYGEKTIKVDEPKAIRVDLNNDLELELGDNSDIKATIDLSAAPIATYTWSPLTKLTFTDNCKDNCAQILKVTEDFQVFLTVTDSIGCMGVDTVNVIVRKNRNVFIPNIFSPNVDGINDWLEVFADPGGVEKINYFKVYDRWGNQMFESPSFVPADSRNAGNRWDGFYKGNKANEGVYVYLCEVKFIDGVVLKFRGDTTIVR